MENNFDEMESSHVFLICEEGVETWESDEQHLNVEPIQ